MPDAAVTTQAVPEDVPQSAGDARERGVAARRVGRREEAITWFRRAVDADPADPRARLDLATALREAGRLDEAEPLFRALLDENSAAWPALTGLGICARQRRDLAASAAHLAAALALAPNDRSVRHEYATTLREQRRIDEAEPLYRSLVDEDPKSWPALVGLGICARQRRDLAGSAAHFAAALALAPRDRALRHEYATTLREQRRREEAEPLYRGLLADDPGFWPALLGLGLCARQRRDLTAAAEHLAAALAIVPRERGARLEYAHTLREQRRIAGAEAEYRVLLAEEPEYWQAHLGLGLCARLRNDRAAATAHFAAAVAAAPETADGPWFELAGEHRDAGRFEEARALLRAQAARDPAGGRAWLGLGIVERLAGDRAAALETFREGFARDPSRPQLMIEIAIEERAQGRYDEAERWLRRAVELPEVAGAALVHLGHFARLRQQLDEALELFRRAAARPDAPIDAHAAAAQTLADLGRMDEAFAALDAAETRVGIGPELAAKRVFLLRRVGQRAEALDLARTAVAAFPADFALWSEWFETERFSGDFAGIDRCLAVAPAGNVHQVAHWHVMRGHVAAQRWQFAAAVSAYQEGLARNPALAGVHEALARVHLLRFDIPAARAELRAMRQKRAADQREQGLSPHLAHTHIGNFFDEFVIDPAVLERLVAAQELAPDQRIAPLLAVVEEEPDHTAAAIALLVALRQAGRFDREWPAAAPLVPARIAQFWDEPAPPADVAALMESWRARNPGHQHLVFNRDSALDFLKSRCPVAVQRAFVRAREPAMKADIFRLAWLFAEGGIYADADDRCLRPVGELVPESAGFVAFQEEYGTLGNNFLAAAPLHPVIGLALQRAVAAVNRGDDDMIWLATGPGLVTRAFTATLASGTLSLGSWLKSARILDRHELERVVATHCAVGYKLSRKHWLRATFGQPKAERARGG